MGSWFTFAKVVSFRQRIENSMLVADFCQTFNTLVTILKVTQFNCNVDYWFGTEIFNCGAPYMMISNGISADFSADGVFFSRVFLVPSLIPGNEKYLSFGQTKHRSAGYGLVEVGLALLDEGPHAFAPV